MRYGVAPCKYFSGEWIVEAIDFDGEGEVDLTRFSGPLAEDRAREYTAWKNSQEGIVREQSPRFMGLRKIEYCPGPRFCNCSRDDRSGNDRDGTDLHVCSGCRSIPCTCRGYFN